MGSGPAPALAPSVAPVAITEPAPRIAGVSPPSVPTASPLALPPEAYAMLELVGLGLAPDADDATRGTARDLWARFAQSLAASALTSPATTAAASQLPGTPMMPPTPAALSSPMAPVVPTPPALSMPLAPAIMSAAPIAATPALPSPTTPIAMAASVLRNMPPDQLMDLLLQRLRGALPPGVAVPTPRGIQFQLIPVPGCAK
jgi:hypothetical protein